jgi:hypothetical protein
VRILEGVCAAALALAAFPANAVAGEYHVYSCRTPSGESAPADGWSGSKAGTYTYTENTCSQPTGGLVARLGDEPARTANTDIATWEFAAPATDAIVGATLWRAGDAAGGAAINATYEFWFAGPHNFNDPANAFDVCVYGSLCPSGVGDFAHPGSTQNRLAVPIVNLGSHLFANASCVGETPYKCPEGKGDANGNAAAVYLYAADITLAQGLGPSAGNVSGELATAPTVSGTSDVTFSASDPGSGVYEAVFTVDGQMVGSAVVNDNGGRCRNVGQTTDAKPAFLYVQPCLASVSADVGLDTTKLANGAHHLIVSVIDAAGNGAPVLDRVITVANPPLPCTGASPGSASPSGSATLSASWRGTRKQSVTSSYGRAPAIDGRLSGPGGATVGGATIDLVATPTFVGGTPISMPSPRTRPDGRFSVRLPAGVSSRTLCFAYRPAGASAPVATRTLILNVRASIALRVAPRTASVGRSIFFHGRLRGGPVPPDGKQLVLEARSPGSQWLEFRVIRTNARGRFSASYTFRFPGPARYQFRALSEPESDYPFAAGTSNVVAVRER